MQVSKKALIFGVESFTGKYLQQAFEEIGIEVFGTTLLKNQKSDCDITKYDECSRIMKSIKPDYVVNLSGISFVPHGDYRQVYEVNFSGAVNVIKACEEYAPNSSLLLISSGQTYAALDTPIKESDSLELSNHYSVSKNAMESVAKLSPLNVKIARSFNYTGVGQNVKFLIPKIVSHYKQKSTNIVLGDVDVFRDFSDVRDVVKAYVAILLSDSKSKIFNVCSNTSYSISEVLTFLNQESGYEIEVAQSKEFMRANVVSFMQGDNEKLRALGWVPKYSFRDTLKWMLNA